MVRYTYSIIYILQYTSYTSYTIYSGYTAYTLYIAIHPPSGVSRTFERVQEDRSESCETKSRSESDAAPQQRTAPIDRPARSEAINISIDLKN